MPIASVLRDIAKMFAPRRGSVSSGSVRHEDEIRETIEENTEQLDKAIEQQSRILDLEQRLLQVEARVLDEEIKNARLAWIAIGVAVLGILLSIAMLFVG